MFGFLLTFCFFLLLNLYYGIGNLLVFGVLDVMKCSYFKKKIIKRKRKEKKSVSTFFLLLLTKILDEGETMGCCDPVLCEPVMFEMELSNIFYLDN